MFRTRYAAAVSMTAIQHRASVVDPPADPITGEKREGSKVDPDGGAQKYPRHMGNLTEGVTSYSHEFSDSWYPRHFTRYWYWP